MVRVHSLLIRSDADDTAPHTLKLFKNRPGLDFAAASELRADATFEHAAGSADVHEYAVRRAVFSNVRSVQLFVEDSAGADVSRLYYVGLRGDWTKLSKDPVITLYEAAANPRDHKSLVPGVLSDYSA
ncbi:galactose-binding domain-like protein [Dipodascopsis tothii]|uniref:galactose-binding domain-like protein n=1 Tax=Dipodascopsis tothii TaxID=44089 RepID=UPI0034CF6B02